jgi:LysM repeat protein
MDGILTLTGDSEITFTYVDEVPRVTKRAIVRMATKGVLQVGPRLFNGFPALSINLTDGDLNTKASVREVVTVEVVNQRFPDQIARVGLLESAPSSGFFQGSITLTYASTAETVNDGTLRGLSGDLVNVSYQDALPESLVQMTTALRFAGGLQVSNSMVAGNELFSVSLFDGDLNSDKTKSDPIIGVLSLNSDLQGPIMVSMTETGVENGIFTASILPRLEGTSIEIDAIDPFKEAYQVRVAKGKDLRLTYIDPDNGIPVGKTVTVFTKARISLAVIYSGKNVVLQVTMTDADLMGSSAALTAQVYTSDANQPVETVKLTATSVGSEVFTGNVLAQAHMGVTPAGKISLRDTDTIFVRYYDEQPATVIVEEVSAPKPRFLEPTPFDDTKFVTAVDCVFQIGLRGADRSVESQRLIGATVVIKATRYRDKDGTFKNGVIPGGSLSYAEPGTSFETSMSWRPRPEQEGGVFISCFAVMESHSLVTTVIVNNTERSITERCFEISVMQCRKCALPGETLNQMALLLGSEWLTIWSLNPKIKMPQEVLDGTLVNTSLVYKVKKGDSMASLSMRFGTTVKFLLAINADLTVSGDLKVGQTICVLPNQVALDGCPPQARSTTWEKLEEQYVPVDYFDNPFNWEDIQWTDLGGKPVKKDNPDYPQLPARKVEKELGYSKRQNVVA